MVSEVLTHKHHRVIFIHCCYEDAKIIFGIILLNYQSSFYFETKLFWWHGIPKLVLNNITSKQT